VQELVTFRLTVEQFRRLLEVVLVQSAPDHLTNLVLLKCTRPHGGVISVPIPRAAAQDICQLVFDAAATDPTFVELGNALRDQLSDAW